MGVVVAGLSDERVEDFVAAMGGPFMFDPPTEEGWRDRFTSTFEIDRARCAYDSDQIVGTLGAFSLDLTVPGGPVSCAGTTMVSVQTTHRRAGLLRALMRSHFDEARDRGEPLAALWASDSAIYGRFGFGCASLGAEFEIGATRSAFHRNAPAGGPVQALSAEQAAEVLPPIYDQVREVTPGMYRRSAQWWTNRRLFDSKERRNGYTAFRYAIHRSGTDSGYVQYRTKGEWDGHHGSGEVKVVELMATGPRAHASLWAYVLSHDLTAKITAADRPLDDPVFDLLEGRRRAAPTVLDALWVRLLDVPGALMARRYSSDGRIVLDVSDPFGDQTGRWMLEIEGGVAACTPTTMEPELVIDIEELGSVYLGRSRLVGLRRAGRVSADPSVAESADRLFEWPGEPWCPEVF